MAASHRAPTRFNGAVVLAVVAFLAVAAGAILVAMHMVSSRDSGKPDTSANDAAASSDTRNAVAVIEQCFADTSSYPAQIDPNTGTVAGCGEHATLSAGSTIAYFSSGSTYIFSVTNSSAGVTGKTYCYSSTQGTVATITTPLTGYRSSC